MAGRERASLMTRDQGAEGPGVGKATTGGSLWGHTGKRALAHSKCSVNGEPEVGGSESETERKPEVPASPQDEALFHCANPSGVPRDPANSTASLTSQRHLGSSLRSPVEVEGNECFPPQPKKDLESPS